MSNEIMFPRLSWFNGSTLNTTVEHGLNLRERGRWVIPDYQRPLVWTDEQKVAFIESLVLQLPIGVYTLYENRDFTMEVLDGQQRWNAIFSYVEDAFPVFGYRFSELNDRTRLYFESLQFPHRKLVNLSYEQRKEAYLRMAYGGTNHT